MATRQQWKKSILAFKKAGWQEKRKKAA